MLLFEVWSQHVIAIGVRASNVVAIVAIASLQDFVAEIGRKTIVGEEGVEPKVELLALCLEKIQFWLRRDLDL